MRFDSRTISDKIENARLPRNEMHLHSKVKLRFHAKVKMQVHTELEMQIHTTPKKVATDGAFEGAVV